ncbi:MAG: hypothetical protein AAGC74_10700 [Verrucomicrobiota bacterium]
MNVRDLNVVLRPRSGWEAVDLGFALARKHYGSMMKIGWALFLPVALFGFALGFGDTWVMAGLVWFLKPVVDRFYLYYLSRRIFGQEVTVGETLGEWKRLGFGGVLSLLTIRRFSFARSLNLPVLDLEGQRGSDYGQRCRVVSRVGGDTATLITFGSLFLQLLLLLSLLFVLLNFVPQGEGVVFDEWEAVFGTEEAWAGWLGIAMAVGFVVTTVLFEPFYLAAGFALYLNSRTSQEAWDVELTFRELAARVERKKLARSGVAKVALWGLAALGFAGGGEVRAADAQESIREVLAHEDFTIHKETVKEWVPKEDGEKTWWDRFWENWANSEGGGEGVGMAFEGLFQLVGIVALVALVVVILMLIFHSLQGRRWGREMGEQVAKRQAPSVVMGMEIAPESLPDDLLGEARARWGAGDAQGAFSLLYRGALSKLILEREVEIEGSDTESECLRRVEERVPGVLAGYFGELSREWIRVAYSKRVPAGEMFEGLCERWPFEKR